MIKRSISPIRQCLLKACSVALSILAIAGCSAHADKGPTVARQATHVHGTVLHGPAPELGLPDGSGKTIRYADLRGRMVVLFFGFSHCGDVCPITLAHLAQAIHILPAQNAARVLGVFITVDPHRDTPAVADHYAKMFDRHFIGLSGTQAQLLAVQHAYHVWSQRLPAKPGSNDYEVSHSTALFLIDKAGNYAEILPGDTNVKTLSFDIASILK
jgi:protein SCO1/2